MKRTTLPLFLALWAVMMLILGALNVDKQEIMLEGAMEAARQERMRDYREIWSGDAAEIQKPAILVGRLGNALYEYGGAACFRFYDAEGREVDRSQMTQGMACPPGTGVYSWQIRFDPVLTGQEQVELAKKLKEDRSWVWFTGTEGGLHTEEETQGRYCEVTGVADAEREIIYPKIVRYVYDDSAKTLMISTSDFFEGKKLTTLHFDTVRISSDLVSATASPEAMLRAWEEAEAKLDDLLGDSRPDIRSVVSSSDGSECVPLGGDIIMASSYACNPVRLTVRELWPTALLTLLAAVAMALYTDKKQRAALARERAFSRAAAHELKTPLAVLRTHAEALREDIAPEKREAYLDTILDESDRMAALVEQLLVLSRLEASVPLERAPLELSDLVRQVWQPLELGAAQKEIAVDLALDEIWVQGDRERLRQAVGNLAANALRHCPAGRNIRVTLARENGWACLRVYNDGAPIAPEDLARLFEPFYRGDKSRSRESGGTGLGLAIVRAAALAHGGSCRAANEGEGVAFTLWLPETPRL